MKLFAQILVIVVLQLSAERLFASIVAVGEFESVQTETWESFPLAGLTDVDLKTIPLIDGAVSVSGTSLGIYRPGRFGSSTFGLGPFSAMVHDGERGFYKTTNVDDVSFQFDPPVFSVGGFWGVSMSVGETRPLEFLFSDAFGAPIGTADLNYTQPNLDGTLEWHGWNSDVPIGRIDIAGGGFFVNDSLRIVQIPEPSVALLLVACLSVCVARKRRR